MFLYNYIPHFFSSFADVFDMKVEKKQEDAREEKERDLKEIQER